LAVLKHLYQDAWCNDKEHIHIVWILYFQLC